MSTSKGVLIGALLGTCLGSLACALYPKRKALYRALQESESQFIEKMKENHLHSDREEKRKFFWGGTLLGILAGVGTTVLLNQNLLDKNSRKNIKKKISKVIDKTEEYIAPHIMKKT